MNDVHYRPPKAYLDPDFLGDPEARPIRILSEYLEPKSRFSELHIEDTILFFGSARTLPRDVAQARLEKARAETGDVARAEVDLEMSRYYEDTRELARRLTEWSKGLKDSGRRFVVCSGGGPGIMEAANRGASEARGVNIGLGISLPRESTCNPYITRRLAFEFHYFFMRKFWFLYLAKAMVIMPGGYGTLDELFEVLTLLQTGKTKKRMPIVLYGTDYWDQVVNLDRMVHYGTIDAVDTDLIFKCDSVDCALEYITTELSGYALAHPGATL
jgi:uncharacterized protein (TIGR00730 family)